MEDDLQEYLRSRDVSEEDIILMKRDKVGNISLKDNGPIFI